MKTYGDLVGDGGSDIVGQVAQLGGKLRFRLDKIKYKIALMSGKGGVGKSSLTANVAACLLISATDFFLEKIDSMAS